MDLPLGLAFLGGGRVAGELGDELDALSFAAV